MPPPGGAVASAAGSVLLDRLRRPLRDLRISLTDRCNFRCTYCMPREVFGPGYEYLHRRDLLDFEEITRLVGIFSALGTRKIRLTGGEPLMRRNVPELVSQLRRRAPEVELALTTNGSLLARFAGDLHAAGLHRVSVSLDALDDATFMKMNDADVPVSRVVEGIDAAVAAGFSPVKINSVIRRGVNEHAIEQLADRFSGPDHIVRFIEYMDVGNSNGWRMQDVVPASEIAARLEMDGSLSPLPPREIGEVARRFRTARGGEIGIIASVTQPFCKNCNRARLSSDGRLYTCLFGSHGTDLRGPLRAGASDHEIAEIIRATWELRGDRYSELRTAAGPKPRKIEMSAIGG
ncbi:GTP 3',8-cyclase MoaA [Luteolibacter yonseiensis]|uniref:GTP 3',8-cyclase n=2 Tax=Luteolibacter yonseiensis TaxID=1144680 RepID=A0A934V684_9BACT|nr:GTP 3',8-cyclase MoaA [Luteolibacter yonseiensis]